MNDVVAEADDVVPRNGRMTLFERRRRTGGGFTHDLQSTDQAILKQDVAGQVIERLALDEPPDDLDGRDHVLKVQ